MVNSIESTYIERARICREGKAKNGLLLGVEIRDIRESLGFTRKYLASQLNITLINIGRIELDISVQSPTIEKKMRDIINSPEFKKLKRLVFKIKVTHGL